jgi:hypothetical protein
MVMTYLEGLRFLRTSLERPLKSHLITSTETKRSKVGSFNTSTPYITPSKIRIDVREIVLRGGFGIGRVSESDVFNIPSSGPRDPTAVERILDSTTEFEALTRTDSGYSSVGSSRWGEGKLSCPYQMMVVVEEREDVPTRTDPPPR